MLGSTAYHVAIDQVFLNVSLRIVNFKFSNAKLVCFNVLVEKSHDFWQQQSTLHHSKKYSCSNFRKPCELVTYKRCYPLFLYGSQT